MKECPKCKLEWQEPCEQTACIELFGECISCRRFLLTEDEVRQIQEAAHGITGEEQWIRKTKP